VSVLDKIFGDRAADAVPQVLQIPILLRAWQEEDVWNGEAVDLPIAVFGDTFEETVENLHTAVISHLETLQEIGTLDETARVLRACARQHRFTLDEMGSNQPFIRFTAGLENQRVVCIA
jgi:predicted RNase H-like HicB family nuclease